MNRILQEKEGEPPRQVGVDYFLVSARSESWTVSTEMALHIERCLSDPRAAWVSFVDLTGARVRVRAGEIEYLAQSTAEQRAAGRAFYRTMTQERKADRDWSGDE